MDRVAPSEPARAEEVEPGTLVADRYRLLRIIGSGGMGAVWEAPHTRLEARVALKFMASALSGQALALARFRREARAAATLASPHIVRVSDFGVHEAAHAEIPYIVMELLEGEDLHARLARGSLALGEVSRLVREVAKGLGVAHAAGIIHRDLKPRNLFLARAGGETLLKILDFGCAKDLAALDATEHTETGQILGSVHHMSPEQARGLPIGVETDLWAVGVVAYQALFGRLPFMGSHIGDVLVRIACDPAPAPSELDPTWPRALDRFFEKAFAKQPAARFASADEMAAELERVAAAQPDLTAADDSGSGRSAPPVSLTFGRSAPTAPAPQPRGEIASSAVTIPRALVAAGPPAARPRPGHWLRGAALLAVFGAVAVAVSASPTEDPAGDAAAVAGSLSAPPARELPAAPDRAGEGAGLEPTPLHATSAMPTASAGGPPLARPRSARPPAAAPPSPSTTARGDKKYDPFSGIPVP